MAHGNGYMAGCVMCFVIFAVVMMCWGMIVFVK